MRKIKKQFTYRKTFTILKEPNFGRRIWTRLINEIFSRKSKVGYRDDKFGQNKTPSTFLRSKVILK